MSITHTRDEIKTAIAYIRVSTEEQSLGLDAQRERVESYCHARGYELVAVVEDKGASGKTLNRSGMDKVRKIMKRKMVDAVVALKLDRLTRRVPDLHTLMKESAETGVAIVSIMETLDTSSAAGRLMVHMLAGMAEWERDVIAERTSAALTLLASRGERVGRHAAIGSANGEGARQDEECRTLAVLREIILGGSCLDCNKAESLRCMADMLEAQGCTNRAGKRYGASSIQRMKTSLAAVDAEVCERLYEIQVMKRDIFKDARRAELMELLTKEAA